MTRFGLGLGQRSTWKFSLITLHSSYSDSSDTRRCTVTVVTCAHLTEQCMCSCWSHCRQYRASFKLCRTCRRTEQEPRLLLWGVRSSRNVHHPQQPAIFLISRCEFLTEYTGSAVPCSHSTGHLISNKRPCKPSLSLKLMVAIRARLRPSSPE
jgi:hypothetical protein